MLIPAIVAAWVIALQPTTLAELGEGAPAQQAHRVGETLSYSLRGDMSQSILGKDGFGKHLNQMSAPTNVKGHESIAITGLSADAVTLRRSGTITATVDGAKPVTTSSQGWTIVDSHGRVTRDKGKLGGLFLLPLAFLGEQSVNAGNVLQVGDRWSAELGTKLYGMTQRPLLQFTIVGQRRVLGINVFTIEATGTAPMKEPVMTASGIPLGYATGVAQIKVSADYDRDNRRLVSLDLDVHDTLHYVGSSKHIAGSVKDHQRYLVALDASSMANGSHADLGADPVSQPQP